MVFIAFLCYSGHFTYRSVPDYKAPFSLDALFSTAYILTPNIPFIVINVAFAHRNRGGAVIIDSNKTAPSEAVYAPV